MSGAARLKGLGTRRAARGARGPVPQASVVPSFLSAVVGGVNGPIRSAVAATLPGLPAAHWRPYVRRVVRLGAGAGLAAVSVAVVRGVWGRDGRPGPAGAGEPRGARGRALAGRGPPPRLPVGSAVPEPGGFPGRWGGASRPQGPPAPPVRPSSTARSPESEEKYRGGHGLVVPWDPPRVRYVTRASVLPRTLDDSPCDCSYEVHPVRSIRSTPLRNRRVGTLPAIPARASLLTRRRCSRRGTPIPDPHRAVWCERR